MTTAKLDLQRNSLSTFHFHCTALRGISMLLQKHFTQQNWEKENIDSSLLHMKLKLWNKRLQVFLSALAPTAEFSFDGD